ncbi:type 2 isopentenyl-diphosphate Delta-isomerase [Geoglobus acetivorans]|uniref:Isopentenyl-diphosphate delta-isomerase n=1 Tax=Geoglobus acetivorans TaxID=565033 RepID=A0A0A7GEC6_GEOAI|nr:Isopentenyl-diphosphate delta-isomerase, FMN-dependent [Geoglobus acetivorans]
MTTTKRKLDHINICLNEDVESSYTGFGDVTFIHNPLPEVHYDEIDMEVSFLGKKLKAPFLIASMTGGHPETYEINKNLAIAVENAGIGMGVGSQRAGIEDETVANTFAVVREHAPNAFIYANIGLPQLIEKGIEYAEKAVEMIDADALAIHLNFLQEIVQPEGDRNAEGGFSIIREVASDLKVPVMIKETGAGIPREIAFSVREAGVKAIDIGGKGGTSWSGVEVYRIADELNRDVARDFWDWGIPTAFSIVDCHDVLPVVATGGIRNGIDAAKAIALGAKIASSALPFLKPAKCSVEDVERKIRYFLDGLKKVLFLTGCTHVYDLHKTKIFVSGLLKEWIEFRELDYLELVRRRFHDF